MARTVYSMSMTNPEADCYSQWYQGQPNTVKICYQASAGGSFTNSLMSLWRASLRTTFGTWAVQPTKFRGRLTSISATTSYAASGRAASGSTDITLYLGSAAAGFNLCASGASLTNIASNRNICYRPNPPITVDDDLFLAVYQVQSRAATKGSRGQTITLRFEP